MANQNVHTNGDINGHTNGNASSHANGHANSQTANFEPVHLDLDALIVGAGFAGVYLLYQLRKEGLNARIVEAGRGLGGVWHWSNYPGARVDTQYPSYALNIPEVYSTWSWTEEFPCGQELRDYFQHVDNVLDISKHVFYGSRVVKATFEETSNKWLIEADNGNTFTAQFFVCCLGFSAISHIPDWPGLKDNFQGQVVHSNFWPAEGIDMHGKKVAVVGTGPTGLQIAQEAPRTADKVTCFVRSPNLSWPMRRRPISPERALNDRGRMGYLLGEERFTRIGGMLYEETTRKVFDENAEEREARLDKEYRYGGFRFFFEAYIDILLDQAANDEIYRFWRRKVHERMTDKRKAEILAPEKPPYPFAGKRPSLEQDYYEQMDQPHVTLVDVKATPVTHVVSNGIVTADGTVHEADLIIMATGYDAITGGIKNIDITGLNGLTINEKWKSGTHAYLGMTVSGFPNFFYTYGPLSPVAYASGPSTVESQSDWIVQAMRKMRSEGMTRINATEEAERSWKSLLNHIHAMTLRENVEGSWYLGYVAPRVLLGFMRC